MIDFEVRRNCTIIAVLTGHVIPMIGARLMFRGHEYQVITVRHSYFDTGSNDIIQELDIVQVHVNHLRSVTNVGS